MQRLAIISPSIRKGRRSHRVALYFENLLKETNIAEAEIIDLLSFNFPLFNERLIYQDSPSQEMVGFSEKIKASDGVIIITPEYNGGYPASLKNAIDLLTDEWSRKPVAFVPVSDGSYAGSQVIVSLQFTLWKMGAITVPGPFRIPNIITAFNPSGIPANKAAMDKRGVTFVNELLWYIEAKKRMLV